MVAWFTAAAVHATAAWDGRRRACRPPLPLSHQLATINSWNVDVQADAGLRAVDHGRGIVAVVVRRSVDHRRGTVVIAVIALVAMPAVVIVPTTVAVPAGARRASQAGNGDHR